MNKHTRKVMFSSKNGKWETPGPFLQGLVETFTGGRGFDLDPCCQEWTAKAPFFYTPVQDGLILPWFGDVFENPPYGAGILAWLRKAFTETASGRAAQVVALIPARTDTAYWHRYVMRAHAVWFVEGRITFIGHRRPTVKSPHRLCLNPLLCEGCADPAPFPSAVVQWIAGPHSLPSPMVGAMGRDGRIISNPPYTHGA